MSGLRASIVLATYNRPQLLARLLGQLDAQTVPPDQFEVIVVDDGSSERFDPASIQTRYPLRYLYQSNQGAASARHAAIVEARGELVVITDDDMQVAPGFLAAHLAHHAPGARTAVFGAIRPDAKIASMPLFERFHAQTLEARNEAHARGTLALRGNDLCTGNVSLRREDYFAVGGFDRSLERSEDAELGLRLEQAGVKLVFAADAEVQHGSDHLDLARWMGRAYRYGRYEQRIADKHQELLHADPWRNFFQQAKVKRPVFAAALLAPRAAPLAARASIFFAGLAGKLGIETGALRLTSLAFGMLYFQGLRDEAGSLRTALARLRNFRRKEAQGPRP